jgi:hypothetical protein
MAGSQHQQAHALVPNICFGIYASAADKAAAAAVCALRQRKAFLSCAASWAGFALRAPFASNGRPPSLFGKFAGKHCAERSPAIF